MHADATAQTTIYYDTYVGNQVPVWNGSSFTYLTIGSDEISMGLDAVTPHVASGSVYDIFAVNNSGTLVIGIGPAWSSTTSRGTGAGTTQLALKNGIWTNAVSLTHCWGGASGTTDYGAVSANQATYLGTFYATANGQTGMQFRPTAAAGGPNNILGLWNAYNRVLVTSIAMDSTASWTYASSTWGTMDGSTSNRISWVDGLQQSFVSATLNAFITSTSSAMVGVNMDATSGAPAANMQGSGSAGAALSSSQGFDPGLGLHYIQAMQVMLSSTSGTFYGAQTSPTRQLEAMNASLEM